MCVDVGALKSSCVYKYKLVNLKNKFKGVMNWEIKSYYKNIL